MQFYIACLYAIKRRYRMGVNFKLHATVSKTGKIKSNREKKIEDTKCIPKRFNVVYFKNDGREKNIVFLSHQMCARD